MYEPYHELFDWRAAGFCQLAHRRPLRQRLRWDRCLWSPPEATENATGWHFADRIGAKSPLLMPPPPSLTVAPHAAALVQTFPRGKFLVGRRNGFETKGLSTTATHESIASLALAVSDPRPSSKPHLGARRCPPFPGHSKTKPGSVYQPGHSNREPEEAQEFKPLSVSPTDDAWRHYYASALAFEAASRTLVVSAARHCSCEC